MSLVAQGDFDEVIPSLNDALMRHDFEHLREKFFAALSAGTYSSWDMLSWILGRIDDTSITPSLELEIFFNEAVELLSESLTTKEFVLVLLGEIESSQGLRVVTFSLPFLEKCATSLGLSDSCKVLPIFTSIRSKLHSFLSHMSMSRRSNSVKIFSDLTSRLGTSFVTIFTSNTKKTDLSLYTEELLYYFSEALYFVNTTDESLPIFHNFLRVLHLCSDGLYSQCYEIFRHVLVNSDIGSPPSKFTDANRAWLHVLGLCLTSDSERPYWPTVLTKKHQLTFFVSVSSPYVQKIADTLAKGSPLSILQVKSLIRTQEHILCLASKVHACLTTDWWSPFPTSLIKNLESISKHPISSVKLPVEVKNCISVIESLLSASSITARCQVFSGLVSRSLEPFHCGIRAHVITLFKDFLHKTWLKVQDIGLGALILEEQHLGEVNVTLPFDSSYLRAMCDSIFQYPLPNCDNSVYDQFSWLMAALNLAIYVSIRTKSVSAVPCTDEVKQIARNVSLAFSRPDAKGKSTMRTHFLDPLVSDVVSVSNRYKMAEREYAEKPDPSTIAPGAPSLQECQINLLRFRLLMDTISRVGEFPVN
uniref:Ubiquinone biosynthesis protein n=1 Tax=Mesocestoides corti TaxID=53468 RepID=A0A5K3ET25_MESCO